MATNPFKTQIDELTTATQVKPTLGTFDEKKGVAGRTDAIIASDGPLMQRAAAKAGQTMNARGLTNSSMAIGAGQAAVMDAAVPMATQDAGLFQQQQLTNQQATNQGDQFSAGLKADIGTKGLSLMESARQFDTTQAGTNDRFARELTETGRQFDTGQTGTNARFGQELAENTRQFDTSQRNVDGRAADARSHAIVMSGLEKDARIAVMGAETKFRTDIANNENISQAWGTTMASIDKIQNNQDLDDATKKTMIANANGQFVAFSTFWKKASGGAVDVSDLLVFPASPGAAPADGTTPAAGGSLAGRAATAREAQAAAANEQENEQEDYLAYLRNSGGGA